MTGSHPLALQHPRGSHAQVGSIFPSTHSLKARGSCAPSALGAPARCHLCINQLAWLVTDLSRLCSQHVCNVMALSRPSKVRCKNERAERSCSLPVSVLYELGACVQVLFDINSDGQPLGRIAVELFDDVPVGSLRFYELAEGYEGISYQLSKVNEVGPVRLLLTTEGAFLPACTFIPFPLASEGVLILKLCLSCNSFQDVRLREPGSLVQPL